MPNFEDCLAANQTALSGSLMIPIDAAVTAAFTRNFGVVRVFDSKAGDDDVKGRRRFTAPKHTCTLFQIAKVIIGFIHLRPPRPRRSTLPCPPPLER